jgi:cell wall-associated NlpC family hydrolase
MTLSARVLTMLVAAVVASACAEHQPRIRVLPPALPPGAYEPAPAAPPPPRPGAPGLEAVRIAETMIGAPYREGGALPDGFDCSGLVTWVFARQGIAVPRDVRRQAAFGIDVPRGEVLPGDLVFFATTGSGPTHVGIATGDGRFIHAPKRGDLVRVESMSAGYWASRFVGARRIR